MKVYESDNIRNVAILGHAGSGKSKLSSAFLHAIGKLDRVEDRDDIRYSSSLKVSTVNFKDYKYNFIDTPGYFDFDGEVLSSMMVASSAIVVVDATVNLQVGTEKALNVCDEFKLPRFILLNKIDSPEANFKKVLAELKLKYKKKIAPFHIPWGEGKDFKGFINIVDMFAREYKKEGSVTKEIPDDIKEKIAPIREMLMESVAESSEELLEKYFEGEQFTSEEITSGLRKGVISGDIIPVLVGSTEKGIGMHTILNMVYEYLPSPKDKLKSKTGFFQGQIFKTVVDPFLGRVSYLKVLDGKIKEGMTLHNINKRTEEKIGKIYTITNEQGKSGLSEIETANEGDIVAVAKLNTSLTGDTLAEKLDVEPFSIPNFPKPQMYMAIAPKNKGDEDKISEGLHRLLDEDPSFTWHRNNETKQTIVGVQGDIHINSIIEKLKDKFNVEVSLVDLKIPYRETIKSKSDVQGKYKKQSGGHGQYGDVKIRFEPCDEPFVFTEELFGGSVPKTYVPAVEKGLIESMSEGVLAGFPVTKIKATLYDGSYHDVDSSEMAFKMAASLAYKKGMQEAKPVILEPVMTLKIVVPEDKMGDVIGDITKKRGKVLGMEATKNNCQLIHAEAPESEIYKYAIDLKALTQGMGYFEMEFKDYAEVPNEIAKKIIDDAKDNGK